MKLAMLLVMSLIATPAMADWKPYTVLVLGQAADVVTTQRFLASGRCTEGNSHFGPRPSMDKLVLSSVAIGGGIAAVTYFAGKSTNSTVRILGKVFSYAGGGIGLATATYNVKVCGI